MMDNLMGMTRWMMGGAKINATGCKLGILVILALFPSSHQQVHSLILIVVHDFM